MPPDAARAAHAEDRFAAVLVDAFLHLVGNRFHGFVPGNAHPTRVVFALGVRALHRVVQTVGMVGRLQGRLALAAVVAHGMEGAFIAFGADGAAVFHDNPHAAFHLAACAAAGTDALDAALVLHDVGAGDFGKRLRSDVRPDRGDAGGDCRNLGERTARERLAQQARILLHLSPPHVSFSLHEYAAADGAGAARRIQR
jgi:hypothetical protein